MKTLIEEIAKNCQWHKTVNDNYIDECERRIEKLEKMLPSGSGIDCGCKIDVERSGKRRVIINFSYHFMDENGYYDGWENYSMTITPEFGGMDMFIHGKDRNYIKDYFYDSFHHALNETVNPKDMEA